LKEKITMPDNLEFEVDGAVITTDDDLLDGRQLRTAARLTPPSDYVLVRVDGGLSQSVGLEESVRLQKGRRAAFRSFASDRVHAFTVNERGWEWGSDSIAEDDIRRIGRIADDHELFLDSDQDRAIPRGGAVALGDAGVERVRSRKARPRLVTILVNARAREVEPGPISFERLIALAFTEPPSGPQVSFTVSFRKGPPSRPEGSLLAGQSVDVVQGMTFNVTATDKS
jgi:hypothetical protein